MDPAVDLEVMSVVWTLLTRLGYRGLNFQLNSIGCPQCRPGYRKVLVDYFRAYEDRLNEVDRRRLAINPLRLLDSKEEAAQPLLNGAPHSADYLCEECATHLATLRGYLDSIGMPHSINFRLVRGMDYYTKTVFEVWSEGIGAQSAVCGGGRYDGLIQELGGPPTPGIGFGMGIERVIASLRLQGVQPPPLPTPRVQVLPLGEPARVMALKLVRDLREAGIGALIAFGGRSLKSQLKGADKVGATYALIIGDQELAQGIAVARDLASSQQETVPLAGVADWLRDRL